jgi:hypothetical protein
MPADASPVYRCAPGLRLEALGETWFAYSPLSCETMQLNDETAVILDSLLTRPDSLDGLSRRLAAEFDDDAEILGLRLAASWPALLEGGLVVPQGLPGAPLAAAA